MRALVLALALAGCVSPRAAQPVPAADAAQAVVFRAEGPDFVLRMYGDRIVVTVRGYPRELTFARPAPLMPRWNGEIYDTQNAEHRLWIEVRRYRACGGEGGSSVVIRIDGEALHGCGHDL